MTRAEAQARHVALVADIRAHDHAYYVAAKPTLTDREYDRLYQELLDLEREFPELVTPDSPSQRWVIVDTETDGLSAPIHVVEIAAQLMEGPRPYGQPFQVYLNHDVEIPYQATAIHGYTREFLRDHGRPPVEAHSAFRKYARSYPIAAHNLAYDWNQALEPEWARLGVPPVGSRGFCTMLLSRRVLNDVVSHGLDTLKAHFSLNEGRSHKALADVTTVVRLFTNVIEPRLRSAGLTTFREWANFSVRQPISRCRAEITSQQDARGVRTYFLNEYGFGEEHSLTPRSSANLEGMLRKMAQQVRELSELPAESIRFLKSVADKSDCGPYSHWLRRWLERVIAEGRIDEIQEAEFERALINRLKKPQLKGEMWGYGFALPRELVFDAPRAVMIPGRHFCFTGKAAFGSRKRCEEAVIARGGLCDRRPKASCELTGTDYLVVGSLGNPLGKYAEAVQLKAHGDPILLITEQAWLAAIQQTGVVSEGPRLSTARRMPRKRLPGLGIESPSGGISITIGIGSDGPFTQIERLPLPTNQNPNEP